ncbi:hypothetical protein ACFYZ5_43255 [Streptomyces chartreusis]|uniref:hypothetical protein n=1 Tax=Streptomyces chartreusis TaxID=1969 RepID=UPI00367D2564
MSGLASEEQEAAVGVTCIGAPVFAGAAAVAALSIAVPSSSSGRPTSRPWYERPRSGCPGTAQRRGARYEATIPVRVTGLSRGAPTAIDGQLGARDGGGFR